jgi:hypothetical protein
MAWEHKFLADLEILSVDVTGRVDRDLWEQQVSDSVREAVTASCFKFLVDYRRAEMKLHLIDLYERPAVYMESGMPRWARIALMLPSAGRDPEFIETVTANHGYSVRVFTDTEEAIGWLNRPKGA